MSPEAVADSSHAASPSVRRRRGREDRFGDSAWTGSNRAFAPWIARDAPSAIAGDALRRPGAAHLFGTDDLGRDLFAGVVHGTRSSLVVGFVAAGLSAFVALLVGGAAAMGGGAIDQMLMRGTEFVQAVPRFFLIVLIVSLFGSSTASSFLSSR